MAKEKKEEWSFLDDCLGPLIIILSLILIGFFIGRFSAGENLLGWGNNKTRMDIVRSYNVVPLNTYSVADSRLFKLEAYILERKCDDMKGEYEPTISIFEPKYQRVTAVCKLGSKVYINDGISWIYNETK